MSKDTTPSNAFPLHHYKNDEDVKFLAQHGTLNGNKLTLNAKATNEFFEKEGITAEMRTKAAAAERRLFQAAGRANVEIMHGLIAQGKKDGLSSDDLKKLQSEVAFQDKDYKIKAQLTAHKLQPNPATGEKVDRYGHLTFTHKLKKAVDQDVFKATSDAMSALLTKD